MNYETWRSLVTSPSKNPSLADPKPQTSTSHQSPSKSNNNSADDRVNNIGYREWMESHGYQQQTPDELWMEIRDQQRHSAEDSDRNSFSAWYNQKSNNNMMKKKNTNSAVDEISDEMGLTEENRDKKPQSPPEEAEILKNHQLLP